jgi:hypothetical protein
MFLKQSTASQTRLTPRFVDDTDFKTTETGLTIANTDVKLSANGGASANKNSGGGTHIEGGRYALTFDATDTATVGELAVGISVAGALPVEFKFFVLEEAVYDALYGASALGYVANAPVNVAQVSGDSAAADNLELAFDDTAGAVPWLGIVDQGTAQSATATTLVLRSAAVFADDTAIGMTIAVFGSTQGYWQTRAITDYVLATDTATVDTWTVTPSGTITYKVFATPPGVDAVAIRAALGMALANFDTQVGGITTTTTSISSRLPSALDADDFLKSAIYSVNGSTVGVDKLSAHLPTVLTGLTTAGGTTTTIVLNATTGINGGVPSATNDFYNGRTVVFTSGALAGQATSISDYVGATQTLTVAALTGAPASGVTLVIV